MNCRADSPLVEPVSRNQQRVRHRWLDLIFFSFFRRRRNFYPNRIARQMLAVAWCLLGPVDSFHGDAVMRCQNNSSNKRHRNTNCGFNRHRPFTIGINGSPNPVSVLARSIEDRVQRSVVDLKRIHKMCIKDKVQLLNSSVNFTEVEMRTNSTSYLLCYSVCSEAFSTLFRSHRRRGAFVLLVLSRAQKTQQGEHAYNCEASHNNN